MLLCSVDSIDVSNPVSKFQQNSSMIKTEQTLQSKLSK